MEPDLACVLNAVLYFAYGSNLCSPRLRSRTPSARVLGTARLSGYDLRFNKCGRDGSAKGNIVRAECNVFGVVYDIDDAEMPDLDRAEDLGTGYQRIKLAVHLADHTEATSVLSYEALPDAIDETLTPFAWYVELVLAGAAEHDLPASYIEQIRRVEVVPDPDVARARKQRTLLEAAQSTGRRKSVP
jgi:gamma-glutamylcyclotransferase (GGCT)/AIG2-like uncharacterized protein YtfP